jgi:S-adenosylmethionine decarboxylase
MKAQMYNYSGWINNTDPEELYNVYRKKLINSGFGIENVIEKHFNPHGYTALFLLSESHFAIHTFPEEKKSYIELSSCVKKPFDNFVKML